MIFNWYLLFNFEEFIATDLCSRKLTISLEGVGEKDILVVRGNETSIVYEDVIMPIGFEDDNPFIRQGELKKYAVYKDGDDNVYLGIETSS